MSGLDLYLFIVSVPVNIANIIEVPRIDRGESEHNRIADLMGFIEAGPVCRTTLNIPIEASLCACDAWEKCGAPEQQGECECRQN
jgi:hypothetical protein